MSDALRRALDGISEAVSRKPSEGPIVLSEEYLELVRRVEALPADQDGTDKTWTERALERWRKELESVRETPPG